MIFFGFGIKFVEMQFFFKNRKFLEKSETFLDVKKNHEKIHEFFFIFFQVKITFFLEIWFQKTDGVFDSLWPGPYCRVLPASRNAIEKKL